ncbi:MAG: Gfo/Idh/MocA family oxidoreductase [Gemmataceae bacterium]
MANDLTPEQKAFGRRNFEQASADIERSKQNAKDPSRRTFMKVAAAAGAVVPLTAAAYFGYDSWQGNKAVKAALIGCGDEGGVLVGDHNPEYMEFVAVCDIRPYNQKRIFVGDSGPRKGLNKIYGAETAKKIQIFTDYKELIANAKKLGIEAVVIATPLHTHDVIAIDCMKAGLHVLCEKLMARTITRCKSMIKASKDNNVLLNIGHQRHYSMLYAHALEIVNSGILGDIKHIRALWHRNNSWPYDPNSEKEVIAKGFEQPYYRDGWCKPIYTVDADVLNDANKLKEYGYNSIEELCRWRLYNRTGGGLMAELGSHQLDASSIFLGKVKPLAVYGCGGKFFYGPGRNDRESDDSVFVTFEFPGHNHPNGKHGGKDPSDIVVVTYSSFNTNSFEDYGECLMGSRGTMIVEKEADVFLYKENEPGKAKSGGKDTSITVSTTGGKPAMEASSTWGGGGGAAITKGASGPAWDSEVRGYRTEMEHFAYLIRKWDPKLGWAKKDGKYQQELPKCHGEIAMADAILALTANMAMANQKRIEFDAAWFDPDKADNPEAIHDPKNKLTS